MSASSSISPTTTVARIVVAAADCGEAQGVVNLLTAAADVLCGFNPSKHARAFREVRKVLQTLRQRRMARGLRPMSFDQMVAEVDEMLQAQAAEKAAAIRSEVVGSIRSGS